MDTLAKYLDLEGIFVDIKETAIPKFNYSPRDGDIEYFDKDHGCFIYDNIFRMSLSTAAKINYTNPVCKIWSNGREIFVDGVRDTLTITFPNYPKETITRSIRINNEEIIRFKKILDDYKHGLISKIDRDRQIQILRRR